MADVEARRAEADVLRQRAAAAGALAELRGLVRLAPEEPLLFRNGLEDIERSGEMPNRSASATAVDQILNTRPDVRMAEAQLAEASARINLIRLQARPEISLSGSYMRMDTGFALFGLDASGVQTPIRGVFHNLSIGATVTLPSRDRRQGDVAAATALAQAARHEVDARRLAASAEIEAALGRLQSLEQALAIYATGLHALAGKNLDVVRESYGLGRATLLDVLNETRRYLDVETAYTEVLVETLQARSELASAMGTIR
jgi:outer membrane protein TolC